MKSAIRFIFKHTSGRNVLLAGGAFFLMAFVILPAATRDILRLSQGIPPLDLLFWYSQETAFHHIQAYGQEGRGLYRFILLTADVVFPVIYAVFFSFLLGWLMKKQTPPFDDHWVLFPFILCFFDLLENGCIVLMLSNYPMELYWLAMFAGVVTLLKWALLFLLSVLSIGLLFKWKVGQIGGVTDRVL